MSERPSPEEIERAYVRRRPEHGPMTRSYGRAVRVSTMRAFWFFEIVCGALALYALADVLFGLGGGNGWVDVFLLLGLMLFGLLLSGLCHLWFAFIGFGPPDSRD